MANLPPVNYTVDPSTNPGSWPTPAPELSNANINRVDVIFININGDSNLRIVRTGTNEHVHHAVMQVTKHIARGLYRIVSMNVSDYSNGFPWDRENDPQPEVILK
ncbi:hypothetical protein BHE90_004946 [Fusarium euwallaceae]|uniref:Uncharacterized protein n=5 Tax=Fusarium solani species complex TaxID=232080 RepID=A0A428SSA5_9HYPO|nr:hypothetical protein CEP51_009584 [Fusarium floridanum]RSL87270.1 hypothetical protein CDV31_016282 [Fusarium ambrosium]RSL92679.1 hypothetical protein CEP52_013682 [Fusarium oligoseptatum]RTE80541.1 hypothetical protein BHE90_004946 [Fusarium euwallaceae]